MRKILFLDFDGVLNSLDFMTRDKRTHVRGILDPLAVERLNRIVDETKCEIVVSSSWRLDSGYPTVESLANALESFGFKHRLRVVDKTRCILLSSMGGLMLTPADRGLEIQDWLNWHYNDVGSCAILEYSMPMGQLEHFTIRTTWEEGLTDELAKDCIRMIECNWT